MATVAVSRYVSLGSILLMIEFTVLYFIFAINGFLCFNPQIASSKTAMIESMILVVLFSGLAIYKHKANILRLKNHEENKLF